MTRVPGVPFREDRDDERLLSLTAERAIEDYEAVTAAERIRERSLNPQDEQDLLEMCGLAPYESGKPPGKKRKR
jgi:hypothetical protein